MHTARWLINFEIEILQTLLVSLWCCIGYRVVSGIKSFNNKGRKKRTNVKQSHFRIHTYLRRVRNVLIPRSIYTLSLPKALPARWRGTLNSFLVKNPSLSSTDMYTTLRILGQKGARRFHCVGNGTSKEPCVCPNGGRYLAEEWALVTINPLAHCRNSTQSLAVSKDPRIDRLPAKLVRVSH